MAAEHHNRARPHGARNLACVPADDAIAKLAAWVKPKLGL